jgi:hypothetical protein
MIEAVSRCGNARTGSYVRPNFSALVWQDRANALRSPPAAARVVLSTQYLGRSQTPRQARGASLSAPNGPVVTRANGAFGATARTRNLEGSRLEGGTNSICSLAESWRGAEREFIV